MIEIQKPETNIMKGFAVNENRMAKAKKIESILKDYLKKEIINLNILDIGAGDGTISSYMSEKGNNVVCVDIEDQRAKRSAKFIKVNSSKLPLQSNHFDIVISNHVIEHIKNQKLHLKEIKRVLKQNGVCYLATPNRNFPIEPHYKLPFIHYLPQTYFFKTLQILGIYKEEVFLLSYHKMLTLFKDFPINEYTHLVIKNPAKYYINNNIVSKLPNAIINKLNPLSPANIFILAKGKMDNMMNYITQKN